VFCRLETINLSFHEHQWRKPQPHFLEALFLQFSMFIFFPIIRVFFFLATHGRVPNRRSRKVAFCVPVLKFQFLFWENFLFFDSLNPDFPLMARLSSIPQRFQIILDLLPIGSARKHKFSLRLLPPGFFPTRTNLRPLLYTLHDGLLTCLGSGGPRRVLPAG